MTNQTKKTITLVLLAPLLAGLVTGCKCCWKPCSGPIILEHPASQIVTRGDAVTLSVDAKNRAPYQADPVEYQWYFNFAPMAGEKGKTLTINSVQPGNAGRYFAIAAGHGTSKSCDADILVNTPKTGPTGNGGALTIGVSSFSTGSAEPI